MKPNQKFQFGLMIAVVSIISVMLFVQFIRNQSGSTADNQTGRVQGVNTAPQPVLRFSTSSEIVSQNVIRGGPALALASFVLDTSNSSQEIKITRVLITEKVSKKEAKTSIRNLGLFEGNTLLAQKDTTIDTTPSTSTKVVHTFTFTEPLVIRKGDFKIITLRGYVLAGANGEKHTFSCADKKCIVATGNTAVVPRIISNLPATMTIVDTGTFKLSVDESNPRGQSLDKNARKAVVLELLMKPETEAMDLVSVYIETAAVNRGELNDEFSRVYLYDGDTELASATPTSTRAITFENIPAGRFRMPNNAFGRRLTIKADVASSRADTGQGLSFRINEDAYQVVGVRSGTAINSKNKSGQAVGNRFTIR